MNDELIISKKGIPAPPCKINSIDSEASYDDENADKVEELKVA